MNISFKRKYSSINNPINDSKKSKKSKNIINNDDDDNDDNNDQDEPKNKTVDKNNDIYILNNHLHFYSDITDKAIDTVKKLMRDYYLSYLNLKKNKNIHNLQIKPLYFHINSCGGSVYAGLNLYDFMIEYMKVVPIYTIVESIVASAATFFSIIGTKRYISPNAYMLIHQLSTFMGGNYEQIKDDFHNTEKIMDQIINIYIKHTKLNKKKIQEILKHDINWNADECLKNGLIDEIKLIDVFNEL
jgi:ATP-dependent protease ClpP protease subunit